MAEDYGKTKTFNLNELTARYEKLTACVIADCTTVTESIGGQPAGEAGVRQFVAHHLKLVGEEAEDAIRRIMREEIGERDVPSETGELKEKLSYDIRVVRHGIHGPWLGDHMVKSCLKVAASRIGLFQEKLRTKGDMVEMGSVRATGISLQEPEFPWKVYLRDPSGERPAETYFRTLRGRVQSPMGSKSIVNDCEAISPGSRFQFQYRFFDKRITDDNAADIFACAMTIGLGSAKAFECGKFVINKLTIRHPE